MGNVESTSENIYNLEGSKMANGDLAEGNVSYNQIWGWSITDNNNLCLSIKNKKIMVLNGIKGLVINFISWSSMYKSKRIDKFSWSTLSLIVKIWIEYLFKFISTIAYVASYIHKHIYNVKKIEYLQCTKCHGTLHVSCLCK